MILTLVAIIALIIVGLFLAFINDNPLCELMGALSIFIGCFSLVVYMTFVGSYIGASYKADIINREYNTKYTQAEVFYASDVIDLVRKLDRKRIEVNGNLITGK